MHRRYFSGALLAALAMIGSLVFATAAPAADHPVGIGITYSLDAPDIRLPIANISILPVAPCADTPELIEIANTGPMAPVYHLSWQTDGASLLGFHRLC